MKTAKLLSAAGVAAILAALALTQSSTGAQETGMIKERFTNVKTATIEYTDGDAECEGFAAWDANREGRRPAVLIMHDWMGRGAFDEQRARELAALGYVGFSVDIYGAGVRPQNRDEARAASSRWYGDREALRARLQAGLEAARSHELVDASRIAVMGYCFGGACALELARSGAELVGAVSFHGGLATSTPAQADTLKAKILVLHGADDPSVPMEQVQALWKEMQEAKADWRLVAYGNAVHSFTNPAAGNDPSRGNAYDEKADRRSWIAMKNFFEEIFS